MAISQHLITSNLDLQIKQADIGLDEDWSPYCQATIVASINTRLEDLDPRKGARLQFKLHQLYSQSQYARDLTSRWAELTVADLTSLYAGKTVADLTKTMIRPWNSFGNRAHSRSFNLGVRSRAIDYAAGEITLTLSSDEKLLQDYCLTQGSPWLPGTSSVKALVELVLGFIGAELTPTTLDYTLPAAAAAWQPGVSAWSYISPFLQTAGFKLWCDEMRSWNLTDDTFIATGQTVLASGESGGPETITDTIDRGEEWFDAVVIRYEWTDGAGATQTQFDIATETPEPTKVLNLTHRLPYPGPGGARSVLNRSLRRGRRQVARAVNDYRTQPYQPLRISLDDAMQAGTVSAVRWTYPTAQMMVSSRDIAEIMPESWARLPQDMTWSEIPPAMTWSEFSPQAFEEEI